MRLKHLKLIDAKLLLIPTIALILLASRGDLWIDEIWSILFAENSSSIWDIASIHKHDNNHVLNTIYLYLVGSQDTFFLYRLLSVASGIGSLFLLDHIARQRGKLDSFIVLLVAGTSFPLLTYFSEARGYAPAIFFSMLSFVILTSNTKKFNKIRLFSFWLILIAGILSHATFVITALALFSYSLIYEFESKGKPLVILKRLTQYYSVPFLFYLFFYLFFFHEIEIGGGNPTSYWDSIVKAINLLLGLHGSGQLPFISILLYSFTTIYGVHLLYKNNDPSWIFFIVILIIGPASLFIITQPQILQPRYFILCFPFYYLLLSYLFSYIFHQDRASFKVFAILLLCFILIGQSLRIIPLINHGRGDYQSLVEDVIDFSTPASPHIMIDHDRSKTILLFYFRIAGIKPAISYLHDKEAYSIPPEWFVRQSQGIKPEYKNNIDIDSLGTYRFIKAYNSIELSGMHWYLYQRHK